MKTIDRYLLEFEAEFAAIHAERDNLRGRLRRAVGDLIEIEYTLGKALGHARYKDEPRVVRDREELADMLTAIERNPHLEDNAAVPLAMEAADRLLHEMSREHKRLWENLHRRFKHSYADAEAHLLGIPEPMA